MMIGTLSLGPEQASSSQVCITSLVTYRFRLMVADIMDMILKFLIIIHLQ
jgi:hypothetical protein